MAVIRVALAQVDLGVGSFGANLAIMGDQIDEAKVAQADLIVFPALATSGYPPGDLLLRESFVAANLACIEQLAERAQGIAILAGYVELDSNTGALFNAMAYCVDGKIQKSIRKPHTSIDDGFIEDRYFQVCDNAPVDSLFQLGPLNLAISWGINHAYQLVEDLGAHSLDLVLNLEPASFYGDQQSDTESLAAAFSNTHQVALAWLNAIGAHDELVFSGGSLATDHLGEVVVRARSFQADVVSLQINYEDGEPKLLPGRLEAPLSQIEATYEALLLGTREYLNRNGFTQALVSLSGGVDSAVVAAIARDALGADAVHGVMLPSRYSSEHSVTDAVALAENLGIEYRVIEIEPVHAAYLELLEPHFSGLAFDATEENLQARIRGIVVMALSNKFGWLALTGSNKTELAVGYSTMYGDAVGGLAILADVPKLGVYALARHHNEIHGQANIPESILRKAPSAELRPGQSDEQSLPPYELLDPIVEELVVHDHSVAEIVAKGYDESTVRRVAAMIDRAEFKRRQGPPGLKVSRRPFGVGRNVPMTHNHEG